MKTLSEVIKAFEQCKDDKCYGCAYHEKVHANSCIAKRDSDALIYLNAYQWQMTNPDGDHLQLEKCRALLSDFYKNEPLSWNELKGMVGKPVWVEYADDKQQTGWVLIAKNPERPTFGKSKLFTLIREDEKFYLTISGYGKRWKAYRKERG